MNKLTDEMAELESAEDFLDFFGIDYDPAVVRVYRLHILQRFHDYLEHSPPAADDGAERARQQALLARAYSDFVQSTAQREGVFAVFRKATGTAFVPVGKIGRTA